MVRKSCKATETCCFCASYPFEVQNTQHLPCFVPTRTTPPYFPPLVERWYYPNALAVTLELLGLSVACNLVLDLDALCGFHPASPSPTGSGLILSDNALTKRYVAASNDTRCFRLVHRVTATPDLHSDALFKGGGL